MRDLMLTARVVFTALSGLAFGLMGCGEGGSDRVGAEAERLELPGGGVLVRYPTDPVVSEDTLVADLRLGRLDGTGPDVFGEIRGFEVGPDGTIYILDFQASELRAFGPDGEWQSTLTRRGEGPGELSQANGVRLAPDGSLWINDHGARRLKVLTTDGEELARHPMIVPGFGYAWDGVIDQDGVVWQGWGHSIAPVVPDIEATGTVEYRSRRYLKAFDPETSTYDSIYIGDAGGTSYRARTATGQSVFALPFASGVTGAFAGVGQIWTASTDRYRVAQINADLDTLLIVELAIPAPPVTDEDRRTWLESRESLFERAPGIRGDVEALIPEVKPVLSRIFIDDDGRLWVGRTVPSGERPRFDVFRADGTLLGAVRAFDGMSPSLLPLVRDGAFHALVRGEFNVPTIVRAPLPAWLLGG